MAVFSELADATRRVAEVASPSVVAVGRDGRGSGIVTADGTVLTNAHHLRDRTTQLTFSDGRRVQATVVAADVDGDLAVLAADTGDAPSLRWADQPPQAGDVVFGVSAGGGHWRVTAGQITAVGQSFRGPRGRRIRGSVEHSAPLPPGSSGGPMVDADGRVVGINTHRLEHGFYLARPGDDVLRRHVDSLATGRRRVPARLGVALVSAPVARRLRRAVGLPERDGLLVRRVAGGSPAEAAGLREGDLLVAAGGRELVAVDDLFEVLDVVEPGSSLELSILRGAEEASIDVMFGSSDDGQESVVTDDVDPLSDADSDTDTDTDAG